MSAIDAELLQQANSFNSLWWPIYSEQRKIEISERVVETAFKNYEQQWGVELPRNKPTVDFVRSMDEYSIGAYNFRNNSIRLNADLKNHPRGLLEAVGHEGTHAAQDAFRGLERDSLSVLARDHYDTLMNNCSYAHVDMFGIQTQGLTYIKGSVDKGTGEYAELRYAFYQLDIGERESLKFEQECVDAFAQATGREQPYNPMASLEHSADVFKQHYGCEHLTNEEVFQLMDNVQSNIRNNRIPTDALEASVTYDYAALMYEQSPDYDMQRFEQMMDPEEKLSRMQNAGFEIEENIDINLDELCLEENMEIDIDELGLGDNLDIGVDGLGLDDGMNIEFDGNMGDMLGSGDLGLDIGIGDGVESGMETAEEALEAAMEAMERVLGG